jgi:hypothetical protein
MNAAANITAPESARANIARCRAILNIETDPAAVAWSHMRPIDRGFLLVAAELPQRWQLRAWKDFDPTERSRIQLAAHRVRDWAGRMAIALDGRDMQ